MQQQATPFTVADYLLTRLKQLNVTEVFQIPGDYVKHFTQALEHFDGVNAIGCINELDAGYAADAYGRTRGLAAVSLQYGVSTFIALNGVGGSYVEKSPVVVISATPGSDARRQTKMYDVLFHHSTGDLAYDQKVYEGVTVGSITLSTSAGAPEKIDHLLTEALTHKRPVFIECYKEVWGEPCEKPLPETLPRARKHITDPLVLKNAVDQAWSQITAAKKPLIFAGVEVLRHGLSDLLQDLIDASGFLYTTTSLGKTVLDEGGDKFIGTYSDAASIESVRKTVEESDCILTLGTIMTDDYLWFVENKYPYMVLCTTEHTRAGYFTYEHVSMEEFMDALLVRFKKANTYPLTVTAPPQPKYPEPWVSNSDPWFDAQPDILTYNRFFQHSMQYLTQNNLLDQIVWTFGISSAMYVATNAYGLKKNSFLSSAAWQIIGYETGAASGAQLGSGKRAWTVAGDGGFMMVCQSLSTLVRNKLNAVIFVMSNQVYAIEQVYVNIEAFDPVKKVPFDTFDLLPKWNYQALAQAFGANSITVSTVDELNAALVALWTQPQYQNLPTLVEVVIPEKDLPRQMYRLGTEVLPA